MIFKIRQIPASKLSVSQRLKRARKRKKISLEKLEEITKIKKVYLENIERNNFDDLPSGVWTRGFLTKYAEAVGIDPKEILDTFKLEKSFAEDETKNQKDDFRQKKLTFPKIVITTKLIATSASIILFLAFLGYMIFQVRGFAKAPELEIIKPAKDEIFTNSSSIIVEGKTNPEAYVFINNQPIGIDLAGNFSEEVRLREGINEIEVIAKNKAEKTTTRKVMVSVKLPPIAKKSATADENPVLKIEISISPNPVWLAVDADGKTIFQGVMLKDTKQEFFANQELIINTGNAGSTHLKLNGKDLGILGNEGESKKGLKYTPDMIQ